MVCKMGGWVSASSMQATSEIRYSCKSIFQHWTRERRCSCLHFSYSVALDFSREKQGDKKFIRNTKEGKEQCFFSFFFLHFCPLLLPMCIPLIKKKEKKEWVCTRNRKLSRLLFTIMFAFVFIFVFYWCFRDFQWNIFLHNYIYICICVCVCV